MKKKVIWFIILLVIALVFSGCSGKNDYGVSGVWRLASLENYSTGMIYDFDDEVLNLKEDGTGIEVYKPGDYYEEYSYITWRKITSENSIEIKHSEDYVYNLNIVELSNSELKCSFFYDNEPDIYYLATYEKIPENVFGLSGCWSQTEYYEAGEYYSPEESYLYLYPDSSLQNIYYEVEEQITIEGSWAAMGDYLVLEFDGFESVRYEISQNSNRLEIYDSTEEGAEVIYVYKRYFGVITNTPPPTYPRSLPGEIGRFLASVFRRMADNISK